MTKTQWPTNKAKRLNRQERKKTASQFNEWVRAGRPDFEGRKR